MLFAVKNRLGLSLALLAVLLLGSVGLRDQLGLNWSFAMNFPYVLLGAGVIAASDGLLHALLSWSLGDRYLLRFREFVEFFRPQHAPQIIAGGLLAGGEELFFRGIILEGLREAGVAPGLAVAAAAVAFGL